MDTIMQILQWAIPSGGIGAAIAWVANRKANNAKQAKSVHDTYKAMYEDISALLVETQRKYDDSTKLTEKLVSENNLTRRALNRLSRAIEAIQLCPHAGSCPVSGELSLSEDGDEVEGDARGKRKRQQRKEPGGSEGVKTDSTRLTIPLDSLLRLPEGASYTARSGRAHVSVSLRRTGDVGTAQQRRTDPGGMTVYVESGCDSLARLCSYYEEENERLSVANSHQTATMSTKEKTSAAE